MNYKIYTMPHCEKCEAIKNLLIENHAEFNVVDLGEDEGVGELRKIYIKIKDKVKRTDDGQLPIPLFIAFDGDEVSGIGHTIEEVKSLII